jgi:hypothetical protein
MDTHVSLDVCAGDIYEGEFREGKRHGVGMYRYANGDAYEGQWRKVYSCANTLTNISYCTVCTIINTQLFGVLLNIDVIDIRTRSTGTAAQHS